jgi:UDP-GlcNAc:undecaprenyl-phosphate/decaprenyl-phosphate GlcNAc-1-phosphate transferase
VVIANTVSVLVLAFATGLVCTPGARLLAHTAGAIDYPNARKLHSRSIPLLGGAAIYVAFLLPLLLLQDGATLRPFLPALVGGTLIFFVGLWDDLSPLSVGPKLAIQALVICGSIVLGLRAGILENLVADAVLSAIWLLVVMNAFNLLDNMDGLAGGVAAIAAAVFMALMLMEEQAMPAAVAAALAGASFSFLFFNWHPARIFMGDAGSLFIGFILATLSFDLVGARGSSPSAVFVALLILGLPLADTLFVAVSRFRRGIAIWTPGQDHLSHRLLRRAWTPRRVVLVLYAVSLALAVAALAVPSGLSG